MEQTNQPILEMHRRLIPDFYKRLILGDYERLTLGGYEQPISSIRKISNRHEPSLPALGDNSMPILEKRLCCRAATVAFKESQPLVCSLKKVSYTVPCSSCPFLVADKGKCPAKSSCPIFQQKAFYSSSQTFDKHKSCIYCSAELSRGQKRNDALSFSCLECKRLQPVAYMDMNFFELLNDGKITFNVNLNDIRRTFLQLQKNLHPDQFRGDTSAETLKVSDWSAFVNKAYGVLKSPLQRAIYLYNIISNQVLDQETVGNTLSQEELLDILEIREQIQDCHSFEECNGYYKEISSQIEEAILRLDEAFKGQNLSTTRHQIDRLNFLYSIQEAADAKLESLR